MLGLLTPGWEVPRNLGAVPEESKVLEERSAGDCPPSEGAIYFMGTYLCSLDISCNLERTSGPTWRLETIIHP